MSVALYNSLNRKKEEFTPLDQEEVKLYCCGPTVYNYAHIGNLRTYVFEDILVKTLKLAGYKVKHVMNVTDVGHLTSDADEGEDKMLIAAKREQKSVLDIARMYEDVFFKHTKELGIDRPTVVCRATEHIQDMINFVKALEDKGYAYLSNGNVYFDTSKFKNYGKLSGQKREDLKHGARTEQDKSKRNPSDFVLWFTSSKFENQILQWDSPWGKGYPGWHIECSAMATKYLGDRVDIHCGGIDHIPVHHENEIAQSEAYSGHPWVNYWLHAEFLQMNEGKMSKSKGDFVTLDTLKEKGYLPEHYKYFCLMSHYKTPATFSYEALDGARNAYENLRSKIAELKGAPENEPSSEKGDKKLSFIKNKFNNYLFDDLKTPQALAFLWEVMKDNSLQRKTKLDFLIHVDSIFSLSMDRVQKEKEVELSPEVQKILDDRKKARENKDWKRSDELRDELISLGVGIKDLQKNNFKLFMIKKMN